MTHPNQTSPWNEGILDGRTALVTGASQGIGREIARVFAGYGATVVLVSRRRDALEQVAREIGGAKARVLVADLADPTQVRELSANAGRIDILVNNAAVHGPDVPPVPLVQSHDEHFDKMMTVNVRGPYVLARALGRAMAERGTGSIINVSSVAADWMTPGHGLYAASKSALNVLTRTLALELGPMGVRCNAIAPGITLTPELEARHPETLERMKKTIPLARCGRTREIADVAVWLASEASSFVTGQVITVDGGMTLGLNGVE